MSVRSVCTITVHTTQYRRIKSDKCPSIRPVIYFMWSERLRLHKPYRADRPSRSLITSHPIYFHQSESLSLHVLLVHATASAEVTLQFTAPPAPPSNHNTSRAPRTPSRRSARPSPGSAGGSPRQARRRARAAPARKIYSIHAQSPLT